MPSSVARSRRFTDKVVLVTGGTRGIGRAVVDLVAEEGASVVFCGRKPEACQALSDVLRGRGVEALGVRAHIGDADDRARPNSPMTPANSQPGM